MKSQKPFQILFVTAMFISIGLSLLEFKSIKAKAPADPVHFAVIGDFGSAGANELSVADLVKSWLPDFIVTVGDNNYTLGEAATIDANIGQYYSEYIYPYTGIYGISSAPNRFYPALGNHDWMTANAQPYLDYFTLPNNERYYDFVQGPVHFFIIDSDLNEPDGITPDSIQGQWLKTKLAESTSPWRLVFFHHAAYSSSQHGSNTSMQWPFANWGASAVFSGHDHTYERINRDEIVYFVDGLGGASIYNFPTIVDGSQVRYNANYGAMLVDATDLQIKFQFINMNEQVIDSYTLTDPYKSVIDNSSSGLQFNNWKVTKDPLSYAGGYISSSQNGQIATFTTPPSKYVTIMSYRGPNQGIAQIYIDGIFKGNLDLYSAVQNYKYKKIYSYLPLKQHVIKIKVAKTKNPLSLGKQVHLDAIIAGGRTTDNSSIKINYSGWAGSASAYAYGGSYRYTAKANSRIRFNMSGSTVRIITARGPNSGNAILKVDGVAVKTVDLYSPTQEWQYMEVVSGLPDGVHTVEWVAAGTKNPASTGTMIIFDGYR